MWDSVYKYLSWKAVKICKICETIPSFLSFNWIAKRVVRAPNFWGGRNWGRRGTPWRRTSSTWRGWPLRRRRSFRWRCCAFGRQGRCWAVAWIGPGHERWRLVVKSGVVTSGGSILRIEKKMFGKVRIWSMDILISLIQIMHQPTFHFVSVMLLKWI